LHKNHLALFDTPSIEADFPLGVGKEWGLQRYRIEGVFGSIKIKVNSVFTFFREDLAMKRALAAALLYNLDRLAVLTLILIKAHLIIRFLFIPPIFYIDFEHSLIVGLR
jgi:hypothetical protein